MASKLTPAQRVALARHPERPGTADFIKHLFTDFFEQRGDRLCAENGSILGGVALFHGKPAFPALPRCRTGSPAPRRGRAPGRACGPRPEISPHCAGTPRWKQGGRHI